MSANETVRYKVSPFYRSNAGFVVFRDHGCIVPDTETSGWRAPIDRQTTQSHIRTQHGGKTLRHYAVHVAARTLYTQRENELVKTIFAQAEKELGATEFAVKMIDLESSLTTDLTNERGSVCRHRAECQSPFHVNLQRKKKLTKKPLKRTPMKNPPPPLFTDDPQPSQPTQAIDPMQAIDGDFRGDFSANNDDFPLPPLPFTKKQKTFEEDPACPWPENTA